MTDVRLQTFLTQLEREAASLYWLLEIHEKPSQLFFEPDGITQRKIKAYSPIATTSAERDVSLVLHRGRNEVRRCTRA